MGLGHVLGAGHAKVNMTSAVIFIVRFQEDLTIYWKYMYMSGVRVEVEVRDGFMEKVTYEFGHGWTWMGGGGRD